MIAVERAVASGLWRRVVFMCGAQMGKTDAEFDIVGHRLDQNPCPILFVGPNLKFLNEQLEPRVMLLLDEARSLSRKVARGKRMTKTRKLVAGVPLRLAHGGSSTALKSDPAGLAIVDEYDELLRNVNHQGDPLGLVEARGYTYGAGFTTLVSSTPSVGQSDTEMDPASGLELWKMVPPEDIDSGIWKLWQAGTRYHWTWQCPHCSSWFVPKFKDLRWPEKSTPTEALRSAYLQCPQGCADPITEAHKPAMNASGVYVAPGQSIDDEGNVTGAPPDASTASFWVSGLASPFVTFGQRAEAYLMAVRSRDQAKIQTETNAGFGELWAPGGGDAPEHMEVNALKLPYQMLKGDVPAEVVRITMGVDVQKNRLVYVIRGWGGRGTSWLLRYGELWGETELDDVWSDLDDMLGERIAGMPIHMCFIDSGFRPGKKDAGAEHPVYEFCRRHQRQCRPTKGYATLKAGALAVTKLEVTPAGKAAKYSVELVRINADWCKQWVHERIRWPQDQPGAFHLPEDIPDEYALQLVSEARMKTPSGKVQWIQRRRDNHALDCEAMAYAAGYMLNVHRIAPSRREAEEEDKAAMPSPAAIALKSDPDVARPKRPVIRQAARSSAIRR